MQAIHHHNGPTLRARPLLFSIISILLLCAPAADAADRFDIYPGADSACRVFSGELSRVIAATPKGRDLPVIVRVSGEVDKDVRHTIRKFMQLHLSRLGVRTQKPADEGVRELRVQIVQAGERFTLTAAFGDAGAQQAITYQNVPWLEAMKPYIGVCEIGDTPEQAAIEAREAAEAALQTRIVSALPPADAIDELLEWKHGAPDMGRLVAAAKVSLFQQEYVKGDNIGSFRATVRLEIPEPVVRTEIARLTVERDGDHSRAYILIALVIAALLGLVIYGVRLDTRTRGYLTWQLRFCGIAIAAIVVLILFTLL